ncbi:hypothetical protein MKW98_027387, partial [Papaver atlanticum]
FGLRCILSNELLDHIKFDHAYTVSCPLIIYLLEMKGLQSDQKQAFIQFVPGAAPLRVLAALNPKTTIVQDTV